MGYHFHIYCAISSSAASCETQFIVLINMHFIALRALAHAKCDACRCCKKSVGTLSLFLLFDILDIRFRAPQIAAGWADKKAAFVTDGRVRVGSRWPGMIMMISV